MLNKIACGPSGPGIEVLTTNSALPALGPVKTRQQATWSSGDYAIIGSTLQIIGETLCEALDLRGGQRVLDVAAGNGNAALAAARRWCDVTASDYVASHLQRASERAMAERLPINAQLADAEALPFADASFDVVTSIFGVMFTPDHEKSAGEMLRVCRSQGKIGLANWTPGGFIGELFRTIGKYVPPPANMKSPLLWGTASHIDELFAKDASGITTEAKNFMFRYRSDDHWIDLFKTCYGPVLKAFETLDAPKQAALTSDLKRLVARFNQARDGTMVVPGEYLQVIIEKR